MSSENCTIKDKIIGNNKVNLTTNQLVTLIGFDYGTKSIGIAVGQTVTNTANPLETIKSVHGVPDWERIDRILKDWAPQAIIVGVPFNMDDSEQRMTELARDFAAQLRQRFNLPVYEIDERLTTKEARAQLFEEKGYRGLTKNSVDARAAKIILEDWMNMYAKKIE